MLLKALLVVAAVFAALGLVRLAAARRARQRRLWPALTLGVVAVLLLMRGNWMFACGFAGLAVAIWFFSERAPMRPAPAVRSGPMSATEARTILGVGVSATSAEISAAYRAKMSRAHPDVGGTHEQAARLNAAREILLKN